MGRDSNIIVYVIGRIVIFHFIVGILWLISKLGRKSDSD